MMMMMVMGMGDIGIPRLLHKEMDGVTDAYARAAERRVEERKKLEKMKQLRKGRKRAKRKPFPTLWVAARVRPLLAQCGEDETELPLEDAQNARGDALPPLDNTVGCVGLPPHPWDHVVVREPKVTVDTTPVRDDGVDENPSNQRPYAQDDIFDALSACHGPHVSTQELFETSVVPVLDAVIASQSAPKSQTDPAMDPSPGDGDGDGDGDGGGDGGPAHTLACIMCYGHTGSGKTYTVFGEEEDDGVCGMAGRMLADSLGPLAMAMVEVAGPLVTDLLSPEGGEVSARVDGEGKMHFQNATWVEVDDGEGIRGVLAQGSEGRKVGTSSVHEASSRSHAIVLFALQGAVETPLLMVVDLAGADAENAEVKDFELRREFGEINGSLLALKECIRAVAAGKSFIPARNSKLTHILRPLFSPSMITAVIATVSPSSSQVRHTLNTLRYASMISELGVRPPGFDPSIRPRRALKDKTSGKARLLRPSRAHGRSGVSSGPVASGGDFEIQICSISGQPPSLPADPEAPSHEPTNES